MVDGKGYQLETAVDSNGMQRIFSPQGKDITSDICGGQLGGMLHARDQSIPSLQNQLDSLAAGIISALNTAHAMGTDLNGNPGGNLFVPVTGAGSAASMAVAITDPKLLAAGSDGTSGSNGNIRNLSGVSNQAVANGFTPSQGYANVVFQTGMAVSTAIRSSAPATPCCSSSSSNARPSAACLWTKKPPTCCSISGRTRQRQKRSRRSTRCCRRRST